MNYYWQRGLTQRGQKTPLKIMKAPIEFSNRLHFMEVSQVCLPPKGKERGDFVSLFANIFQRLLVVRFRACLLGDLAWTGVFARPERFGLLILLGACLLRYRLFFLFYSVLVIYHNNFTTKMFSTSFFWSFSIFTITNLRPNGQWLDSMGWGLPIPSGT